VDDHLGVRAIADRFERWLATARADDAAAARARERWLLQVAEESSSLAGVLLDLAVRGAPGIVQSRGGRRHRGTITVVGMDFVALRTAQHADLLMAYTGIASVRTDAGASAPIGDREATFALGFAEAIAALASDRPRVHVHASADSEGTSGELRSAGEDVVTIQLDGNAGAAYVPIASISEFRLV
jgi:hypothetical protein